MRWMQLNIIAVLILLSAGCAQLSWNKADRGKAQFDALQSAVVEAVSSYQASVVLVVPEPSSQPDGGGYQVSDGRIVRSSGRLRPVNGLIMTAQGHILMPGALKPDSVERITVWVGDTEYFANVVKADDQLDMTIIKINTEEELTPIPRECLADLKTGSWCVTVRQSSEETDFARFTTLGVCRGEIAGRYRVFDVDGAFGSDQGAPVIDLNGALVGVVDRNNAISLVDLNDDLQDFLDQATGVTSPEEEALQKGWMGVMLQAVNKEYAKEHDLPRSGLWVTHVVSDGPAAASGIQSGDLIVGLNGRPLRLSGERARSYFMKSLRPRVGREFEVAVMRKGKEIVCKGGFEKVPEDNKIRARDIGVAVKSITEIDVFSQNLFVSEGVLVTEVEGGSPAATSSTFRSGLLRNNDVILEVDGKPTPTLDDFIRVLDDVRRDKPDVLLVFYQRGRYTGYAGLNLKIGENGNGGDQ